MRYLIITIPFLSLWFGSCGSYAVQQSAKEALEIADLWYRAAHYEEAIKKYRDARARDPGLIHAWLGEANSYRERGIIKLKKGDRQAAERDLTWALELFGEVLKRSTNNPGAYYGKALLYYQCATCLEPLFTEKERKLYRDSALENFKLVIKYEPQNASAHRYLGLLHSMRAEYQEAIHHLKMYLKRPERRLAELKKWNPLKPEEQEIKRQRINDIETDILYTKELIKALKEGLQTSGSER